jgi:hypothetical protein
MCCIYHSTTLGSLPELVHLFPQLLYILEEAVKIILNIVALGAYNV